jgi:demethylmenaquinone methyltransferase/2-methoxy-6-polyprenyl-1,4-benzoquinol methylase
VTDLPHGAEKVHRVRSMFDSIAGRYDLVNRVMTFGLDVGWRRRAVASLQLPGGSLVLDLACGTGDLCRELRAQGYRAIGFDFSAGMLGAARTEAPLVQADVLRLPLPDASADGATSGFALRNVVDLAAFFSEIGRVLRPGGRIALLDASRPERAAARAAHALYFGRIVPLLGGVLSDRSAYRYLPRSLAYLPAPTELAAMLRQAGFVEIGRTALAAGAAQLLTGTRT